MTNTESPTIDVLVEERASDANTGLYSSPTLQPEALERSVAADPAIIPPNEADAASGSDGVAAGTWHSTKVTAMWSDAPSKGAFAALEDIGWRKIGGTPGAKVSLTMMLATAEQTGAGCRVKLDSDVITAAYVF